MIIVLIAEELNWRLSRGADARRDKTGGAAGRRHAGHCCKPVAEATTTHRVTVLKGDRTTM